MFLGGIILEINFLNTQIKKVSRNLFITHLILFIACCVIILSICGNAINYFKGANPINFEDISSRKIHGFGSNNYVSLTPEDKLKTGLQYVETDKKNVSKTIKAEYYLLKGGKTLIFAAIPPSDASASSYTGWIRKMTDEEKTHLAEYISEVKAQSNGDFTLSDYVLDSKYDPSSSVAFVICSILGLIFLICAVRAFRTLTVPERHRIYKKLAKYGDPNTLAQDLDRDLSKNPAQNFGKIIYTKSWIIAPSLLSLKAAKMEDVLWAYKKVIKKSVNFIPTGKTYELDLYCYDKSLVRINMKESYVDGLLGAINQDCPWVVLGFSKELQKMWKSQFAEIVKYAEDKKKASAE